MGQVTVNRSYAWVTYGMTFLKILARGKQSITSSIAGGEVHDIKVAPANLVEIENIFARLKLYQSIATRFEKLARKYKSLVYLACSIIWAKVEK